jgi:hypothetical protein
MAAQDMSGMFPPEISALVPHKGDFEAKLQSRCQV